MDAANLPPIRPPASRMNAIFVSLALLFGYACARSVLFLLLPATTDRGWCLRDTAADIPRAFFLFCAWRYGLRLWNRYQLGFHKQKAIEGAVLGLLICVPLLVRPFFFPIGHHATSWLPALFAGAVLAGYLEEVLLRSVLLRALFDEFGPRVALWGSSFAFLAFHMQTQPWWTWPDLLALGACFGIMRLQGVTLTGLCLIHAAYNALGVALPPIGEYPPLWYVSVFLVHAYVAVMYGMAYRVRILKPMHF